MKGEEAHESVGGHKFDVGVNAGVARILVVGS